MYFTNLILISAILMCVDGYITYIAVRLPLKGSPAAPGSPWPHPKVWNTSTTIYTLNPEKFRMTGNMQSCDLIIDAMERYHKLIFSDKNGGPDTTLTEMTSIHIEVEDRKCDKYPDENMNEKYELLVSNISSIHAESAWGALRGLETFSQLVYIDKKMYRINRTEILDEPRFRHRGVMLDTSRHFIPMSILLKNLDAMAYNKMNVFHWHIVDDQSFPYESMRFPDLSRKGAYSPRHVYSQEDIRLVLEYARKRGIRVIPEFDTPGHTKSWGKAYPELITPCWVNGQPGKAVYGKHGEFEIINPILNSTYEFMNNLMEEVSRVFPDKYVHLGMDEVYHYCWESNPNISVFMKEKGFQGNYLALEEYYTRRVLDIVASIGSKYVIWQDPIENGVKAQADTIVQVWKDTKQWPDVFHSWKEYIANVTSRGYKTILSSCWYLNVISYTQDWKKYYQCEPLDFNGTEDEYNNVIGGEACLWAEYVDGTNVLSRLWPRASAAAERLWSPRDIKDVDSAAFRLDQHRCRMIRRGIPAQPILDGYCDFEEGFKSEEINLSQSQTSSSLSLYKTKNYVTVFIPPLMFLAVII